MVKTAVELCPTVSGGRPKKKIAIVCAHFMPEIGYQEVYLARAYSRLGYHVRVFSSTCISPSAKNILVSQYPPGLHTENENGYEIFRISPLWHYKTKVIVRGLREAVRLFAPDAVVITGLAKFMGGELLGKNVLDPDCTVVTIFGDNPESVPRHTVALRLKALIHLVGFAIFKRYLYRTAVHHSDRVVLNVPATERIFKKFLTRKLNRVFDRKKLNLRLGYDPNEFFFDPEGRSRKREELRVREQDLLLLTVTRIYPRKRLERIVDMVSYLHTRGYNVKYAIVGFLGDGYSRKLKAYVSRQPYSEHFYCFPFLQHEELRQLLSAADLGIWVQVAISIQEAMGTGLPVLIERKDSTSHLVGEGFNGWYYEPETFREKLIEVVEFLVKGAGDETLDRDEICRHNRSYLSYDEIASDILEQSRHL